MSRSLNIAIISGYTGQEPRFNEANGRKVASFSVAVDGSYKKDGEWHEKTTWVNVTTYGALAEYVRGNLPTGSYVEIQGRLNMRSYTDSKDANHNELYVEITQKGELNIQSKKSATPSSEEEPEAA